MQGVRLDHTTINTADVDATVDFYGRCLGLRAGYRPAFDVGGAWLYPGDGDYPIIHIMEIPEAVEPGGNVDHIAFRGNGLSDYLRGLEAIGERFAVFDVAGTPFTQVHVFDPNGVKIEVTFEEKPSADDDGD